jgi:hypothetical protein
MKITNFVIMFLLGSFVLSGCEKSTSTEQEETFGYAGFNLEYENGGFTSEDNLPENFENEDPATFADDETGYAEDPSLDSELKSDEAKPDAVVFFLRIIWGQIPANPENTAKTVWDGKIYSNSAAIKIMKIIRFEPETDKVLPRTDKKVVEFTSTTLPHNDGLLLKIIAPKNEILAALKNDTAVIPAITFETKPYTKTIPLTDINGLHKMVTVDNLGNKVFAAGFLKPAFDCPKGFIDGYFKKVTEKGGIFGGKWISMNGEYHGKLAGIWGLNKKGKKVIYGIYTGIDSKFKGLVKGHYVPMPEKSAVIKDGGIFFAQYLDKNFKNAGTIKGFYVVKDGEMGKFHGRYREKCACKGVKKCEDVENFILKKMCGDNAEKDCMPDTAEALCDKCQESGNCECGLEDDLNMEELE